MTIGEKPFVRKSVREIIFDGYDDPLLKWVEKLQDILKILKVPIPPDMDKFAIFYKRNMSTYYDGVFNLVTGALDAKNTKEGEIAKAAASRYGGVAVRLHSCYPTSRRILPSTF